MFTSLLAETFISLAVLLLILPATIKGLATSSINSNSLMLALNVECKIKPELREDWLKEIKEDQLCARRDEPDCLQFVLGQDVDDENTFYLFELYRNANAFQHHCQTPHFQAYSSFAEKSQPFVEEPKICFYHPLDEEEADSTAAKRPIQKDAFGLNVNLYPKASVESEFVEVISNNKKGTDATEPLALQYTYGQGTATPGEPSSSSESDGKLVFHFHEQYAGENHGREGFDAHAKTPHFGAWEDFASTDPFDKAPEVFFYHILES